MKARIAKGLERLVQIAIVYSIATYFIELEWFHTENSRVGKPFWLWSERIVAILFTTEYIARWVISKSWKYPLRPTAIIDLISIAPFYIGFFVDSKSLRVIRTLRILRLLKFYRYNTAVHRVVGSFRRALPSLGAVAFLAFIFVFYSSTFIYEIERSSQSDKFTSVFDAMWWSIVTMTTVGYGDIFPITGLGRVVGVVTIIFGIAVFSTFFSILQEAFSVTDSDFSNEDIMSKLQALEEKLALLVARNGVEQIFEPRTLSAEDSLLVKTLIEKETLPMKSAV